MEKKKKDLAKKALTAFILAASLPATGEAFELNSQTQTYLAGGKCAAGSCGAATTPAPSRTSCGAARAPTRSSCGAATQQQPTRSSCGAATSPTRTSCGAAQQPTRSSCGAATRSSCGAATRTSCGAANPTYSSSTQTYTQPSYSQPTQTTTNGAPNQNRQYRMQQQGGEYNAGTAGTSSYQGTSTGPGPNDGYPGTPKGSYNPEAGSRY